MDKQKKPLITIAIPTYNRADGYLKQSFGSALKQTYQNIEIVVADNCSTDDTSSFVKSVNDPRIRYFRQKENIKANDNFNYCLQQAKGDYFLLLHDDDMIDDDFVACCMETVDYDTDIGIIRTGMRKIDSNGSVLGKYLNLAVGLSTEDFFMAWFKDKTPMHLCMSLFNTNKLKQIGGFNSKHQLFQDVLAEVQLAAKFGRLDIKDVKASYRKHSAQNSCSAKMKAWCEDSFVLYDTMCDLAVEKRMLLAKVGRGFFFSHNYDMARKTKAPIDRLISYLIIFKSFGFFYSLKHQLIRNLSRNLYKIQHNRQMEKSYKTL